MKIKKTLETHLVERSLGGVWTGRFENGVPSIVVNDTVVPAEPYLAQLGIKLSKTNKYTERKDHEGMGKLESGGDSSDAGDGISQSEE